MVYNAAMKHKWFLLLVFGMAAAAVFAQKLPVSSPAAVLDGTVAQGEYALAIPLDKLTLHLSRTAETLFVAVEAQTAGWVAFGSGSAKMDKAAIYIGYRQGDQTAFAAERGAGKGHKEAADVPKPQYRLSERDGRTVLELAFAIGDVIAPGQTELECIVAYGKADNLRSSHTFRRAVRIQL